MKSFIGCGRGASPQSQSTQWILLALQSAACFDKETHTHRGRNPRPAHRARQDSTSFSAMANDPLGHHADRSPQCGVPQASALSLLARNERRARSKGEQRRLSERNTGSSPVRRRSINNYPAAAGGDLSATSIGALTAISMVATPHWGDSSLSIDLSGLPPVFR